RRTIFASPTVTQPRTKLWTASVDWRRPIGPSPPAARRRSSDERGRAMKAPFSIRGIRANCGQRAQGFVTIGETASGPIQFPVVILNGADDGPVLCLTAGVHATE